MNSITKHLTRARFLALTQLTLFTLLSLAQPLFAEDRDILWNIVNKCVDTIPKDYCFRCGAPRAEINCRTCRNTTEVWQESKEYVVIRDRKMCGCPADFIHGLTMPLRKITGVEDPQRPDDIWDFAWKAGLGKKIDENELALAVNPKSARSQDQLHVHIVRVIRRKLPQDAGHVAHIDSLDKVWYAAAGMAAALNWKDYGVLVTKGENGKYVVVVDDHSPEYDYTAAECR